MPARRRGWRPGSRKAAAVLGAERGLAGADGVLQAGHGLPSSGVAGGQHSRAHRAGHAGAQGVPGRGEGPPAGSGPDLAEPRDRETYAHDIRSESASPIPDSPPASDRATPAVRRGVDAEPSPAAQPHAEQPVRGEPDQGQTERGEAGADRYENRLMPGAVAGRPGPVARHVPGVPRQQPDWPRSGVNVVGDKPDRSPSDRSDLPPTGEELLEIEPVESRGAAFRRELYKPESIGDIHDTIDHDANNIQQFFERPPTGSHTDVPVSAPQIAQHSPEAATASDLTMAALTVGILVFELGRHIHHKLGK